MTPDFDYTEDELIEAGREFLARNPDLAEPEVHSSDILPIQVESAPSARSLGTQHQPLSAGCLGTDGSTEG